MLESGAVKATPCSADRMRGSCGEVSRYQILPSVWRHYTNSTDYSNPEVAWSVAQRILAERATQFMRATGRQPTALELYLLWNKPDHFRLAGYDVARVNGHYRKRAQRFANLCNASAVTVAANS